VVEVDVSKNRDLYRSLASRVQTLRLFYDPYKVSRAGEMSSRGGWGLLRVATVSFL
jgi:hypothetical protein